MILSNSSSTAQWGKLTSLNPNFNNIFLSKNPSHFTVSNELECRCQIYQDKEDFFICYVETRPSVFVEDQSPKQNETLKIHSGEKITFIIQQQDGAKITMEYVFSGELIQSQKGPFKEEQENNEEVLKMKFDEDLKNETQCILCEKMIYECVSVVPCLHSFCMYCLMQHLKDSQDCPQCDERFTELRKNVFLNNIIEAYDESGFKRDRSQEECRELRERLETETLFTRFEYANGAIYQGEWKKCRKEGTGQIRYQNGDIYEGGWKNNMMEGKGKSISKNGEIYEGGVKNNKRDGKGKKIYKNGDVYEGDWKENARDGKGKMTFADGRFYGGDWRNHKRDGKGKQVSVTGKIYEGEWKNDKRHGKGKEIESDGSVYEGEWRRNRKNGRGKQINSKGDIYEGDLRINQREGKGKMVYKNGDVYEGEWKNGYRCGKGKMIYANGDIFEGTWRNNTDGQGKMTKRNGEIYEGDWKNDCIYRQEKAISQSGKVCEVDRHNNKKKEIGQWDYKKHSSLGKILSESGKIRQNHNIHDKENVSPRNEYLSGSSYWKNNENESKEEIISQGVNIYKKDWQNNEMNSTGKIRKNQVDTEKGKKIEIEVGLSHGDWAKYLIGQNRQMILRNGSIYGGHNKEGPSQWKN